MKEIGSEFYLNSNLFLEDDGDIGWLKLGHDREYVFTGRTAINYVIEDFEFTNMIVYFPSYCCDSMLQPFLNKGAKIHFYKVEYQNSQLIYDIDLNKKCDVFVAMNYFGFSSTSMDYYISYFSKKNTIVIEDITHSLLSQKPYSNKSDYLIASLRKWGAIPAGGLAVKVEGKFNRRKKLEPSENIVDTKIEAMQEKYKYINEGIFSNESNKEKNSFLNKYSKFNKKISNNYENLSIDKLSVRILKSLDIKDVMQSRKENVSYLLNSIKTIDSIELMIRDVDLEKDSPLFLPIIVKEGKRDLLRQELIKNNIYLPIHWPVPKEVITQQKISNIYAKELSLVCDQRYNVSDMKRIVEIIGGYL